MQHFEPQACMKSDLVCAHWNNSYGCMILNSRNTTCWSLPEIGWVSRGPEGLKESSSGHYSATGSLSDHSSSPLTLLTFWSATPSPIIPVQMDVYLDSGPEQDFIVISVECDSENITLGFHSAGKLLFSSINREITSCKHGGAKKRFFLDARFERQTQYAHSFYQCKCLAYKGRTVDMRTDPKSEFGLTVFVLDDWCLPLTSDRLYHKLSGNYKNLTFKHYTHI